MSTAPWIDGMRGASVVGVASALGMKLGRKPDDGIYGCPSCGAERRHTKSRDHRGAVGVRRDGKGWNCFQCENSGDAIDLVAHSLHGRSYRDLDQPDRADVRTWCCQYLGIADAASNTSARTARRTSTTPRPARAAARKPLVTRAEQPEPEPAPELAYPNVDELTEFWRRCRRVDEVPTVVEWLLSKKLDPQSIADGDFARAIPAKAHDYQLPPWAYFGKKVWRAWGYHLIVPMFDASGTMRSVVARNVLSEKQRRAMFSEFGSRLPKSLPPREHKRAGLVLACAVTQHLLAHRELPRWSPWRYRGGPRIETCEGEKKFLMRTLRNEANEYAPLVIGVESGSWTAELAACIPDGAEVAIMTDADDAGAKYATAIVRTLGERIADARLHVELRSEFALTRNARDELMVAVRGAA